jgi:hypothetical protein
MAYAIDPGDSDSVNLGSNPSPPANRENLISLTFLCIFWRSQAPIFMSRMLQNFP